MKRSLSILFLSVLFHSSFGQSFNFALLTDLHITTDSIAYIDLQNSVKQINTLDNIDFVLVTGDITENGDRASLLRAKSVLDKLEVKYYIVSGNHETKWSESGATDFARIFGSECFKFEHDGVLFLGFTTGPVIRMADGHVPPQDITWLKDELEQAGKDKPVFLVTHYPLLEGDVDNWYELTDAVRPYNIRAFLGGHYHQNRYFNYDGIPGFINRSNLRGKDLVGGYSIYEVRPDSIYVYEQLIGANPVKWGTVSMTYKYYTEDNSIYERPNFSVNKLYPTVSSEWITELGYGIYSSPVVFENKIYVGDDLGYLTCLDLQSGEKIWSYQVGDRIVGTPAASENIIVFGSADKNIYGLHTEQGELVWKVEAKEAVLGAVTIQNKIAYVGSSDHIFRAINIEEGSVLWEYKGIKGYVETRPLIYDNKIIFGAWDNNLYALNQFTGELVWKWDGGLTRMHFSPAAVWPVAAHGKVFITDPERAMTAVDVKTGKTVWRTKESMVRETIGLSEDNNRVYSKTMQDSLVCYATQSDVPQKLWSVNMGYGYDHAPSMPVEKDGVVFGSTKNGLIFSVDTGSGELLWKHKVDNSLINTVVPLNNKSCVFTCASGKVGVLKYTP